MSKKLLYKLLALVMLASFVLTACGGAAPAAPALDFRWQQHG